MLLHSTRWHRSCSANVFCWDFINKHNKTEANSHTHTYRTQRGPRKGGRPGLVPGRDLFFTRLQLNYSRQLDWSRPLQTTLLAADLVPADSAHTRTRTHWRQIWRYLQVALTPDLLRIDWKSKGFVCGDLPCSLRGVFTGCCCWLWWITGTVRRDSPSGAHVIFPVL